MIILNFCQLDTSGLFITLAGCGPFLVDFYQIINFKGNVCSVFFKVQSSPNLSPEV